VRLVRNPFTVVWWLGLYIFQSTAILLCNNHLLKFYLVSNLQCIVKCVDKESEFLIDSNISWESRWYWLQIERGNFNCGSNSLLFKKLQGGYPNVSFNIFKSIKLFCTNFFMQKASTAFSICTFSFLVRTFNDFLDQTVPRLKKLSIFFTWRIFDRLPTWSDDTIMPCNCFQLQFSRQNWAWHPKNLVSAFLSNWSRLSNNFTTVYGPQDHLVSPSGKYNSES